MYSLFGFFRLCEYFVTVRSIQHRSCGGLVERNEGVPVGHDTSRH